LTIDLKKFKKFLGGKTLIKNFSNAKVVLVTTISALEAHSEMIDYTFLLPCKNDIYKPYLPKKQKYISFY